MSSSSCKSSPLIFDIIHPTAPQLRPPHCPSCDRLSVQTGWSRDQPTSQPHLHVSQRHATPPTRRLLGQRTRPASAVSGGSLISSGGGSGIWGRTCPVMTSLRPGEASSSGGLVQRQTRPAADSSGGDLVTSGRGLFQQWTRPAAASSGGSLLTSSGGAAW